MTLNFIYKLQAFSNAIRRTFVQYYTRFQLAACSHGSSASAELLVLLIVALVWIEHTSVTFIILVHFHIVLGNYLAAGILLKLFYVCCFIIIIYFQEPPQLPHGKFSVDFVDFVSQW